MSCMFGREPPGLLRSNIIQVELLGQLSSESENAKNHYWDLVNEIACLTNAKYPNGIPSNSKCDSADKYIELIRRITDCGEVNNEKQYLRIREEIIQDCKKFFGEGCNHNSESVKSKRGRKSKRPQLARELHYKKGISK